MDTVLLPFSPTFFVPHEVQSLLLNFAIISSIDRLDNELIMLKQLNNVQQEILEDNFSQNELDSIYHEYDYYYLNNYYENNY